MKKYQSLIEMVIAVLVFGPVAWMYVKYHQLILDSTGRTGTSLLIIIVATVCYVTYDYLINKINQNDSKK